MELSIWYYDLDVIEKFKIVDIKNYFFKESLDKLSAHVILFTFTFNIRLILMK